MSAGEGTVLIESFVDLLDVYSEVLLQGASQFRVVGKVGMISSQSATSCKSAKSCIRKTSWPSDTGGVDAALKPLNRENENETVSAVCFDAPASSFHLPEVSEILLGEKGH